MNLERPVMIVAIILVAIAGLSVYFYLSLERDEVRLPVVDGCALHLEACLVSFPKGGIMTFEINPRSPTPTDTLKMKAAFDQIEPRTVGVRFEGVDMNMGYLEHFVYEMHQGQNVGKNAPFTADAGVFACSSGVMQWFVLVKVRAADGQRYEVPFRFETKQHLD